MKDPVSGCLLFFVSVLACCGAVYWLIRLDFLTAGWFLVMGLLASLLVVSLRRGKR